MGYQTDYRSLGSKRVLVVEDVELNQYLARHIMESWGFQVEIAVNGADALVRVDQTLYDLILMDIQMPVMDGLEATRRIRNHPDPRRSATPIVALTANTFKEEVEQYIAVGMNDCLPKPFDEPRLFKIVSKSLMNTGQPVTTIQDSRPEPIAESSKPYDLSIVIAISGGDEEFVKRMAQLFLDSIPQLITEIEKASAQKNWDGVGKLAHRLKSTIDSMGISALKTDIRSLEKYGKEKSNTELIPGLIVKLRSEIEKCMIHVKKDFILN